MAQKKFRFTYPDGHVSYERYADTADMIEHLHDSMRVRKAMWIPVKIEEVCRFCEHDYGGHYPHCRHYRAPSPYDFS